MTVTHTGEGLRFWVSSADDKDPYLVDMTANKGLPVCACRDFQCRCQPKLDATGKIRQHGYTDRTICKHVQQVLLYLGACVVADSAGKKVTDIYETHTAKTSIQEA